MSNAPCSFDNLIRLLTPQRFKSSLPVETALRCYKKPIDSPGTATEDLLEFGQRFERTAIIIELPGREAEAPLGPIEPENLTTLAPRIDRPGLFATPAA